MTPCSKKGCPAMSDVDVCRVHSPEKIIERVKSIIEKHFAEEREVTMEIAQPDLDTFRDKILHDLESTI